MKSHSVFKSAFHTCFILWLACASSCRSTKSPPLSEWQQETLRLTKEGERLKGLSDRYSAEYAARYGAYRCETPGLPVIKSYKPGTNDNYGIDASKLRPIGLAPGIIIRLQLGEARRVNGRNDTFRTNTRYILEVSGKEMERAESLLSKHSDGEVMGSSEIKFSESTHEVLVEDFIGGAGARYRHIAFLPEVKSPAAKNALPAKWRMVYVDLPSQSGIGSDCGIIGKVHGILNGKIYVEMDGQFYAFPVDEFVEEKLEFTVG